MASERDTALFFAQGIERFHGRSFKTRGDGAAVFDARWSPHRLFVYRFLLLRHEFLYT